MLELLKRSLKDFSKIHKEVITFQLIYFFLTGLVFVPIITAVFNKTLESLGISFLLNGDVFAAGYSYDGLLAIGGIAFILFIFIFIELSVLVIIAQKQYFGKEVSLTDALALTLKRIPKSFGLVIIQLILLLILFSPFIELPLSAMLLENINVPIWLRLQLRQGNWISLLYVLGILAAIYLVLRWVFTIHYIVIEKQPSRRAIRNSQKLTKKNELKIILSLFVFNVIIFGLGLGFISLLNKSLLFFSASLKGELLEQYLMTLTGYLTFGFTLVVIPFNSLWITRLFYRIRRQMGETVEDTLIVGHKPHLNKLESKITNFIRPKRYLVLAVITVYLTITFLMNYTATENILRWNVEIAAHRGGGVVIPENSMKGIEISLDKNVSVIEIDVQMSKDGVIVLNHDSTLKRVAGVNKKVSDLTYAEIEQIDISSFYLEEQLEEHNEERIPRLDEVLIRVKDKARLIIEVKSYSYNQEMIRNLVTLIEEEDMVEQCMVQSFNNQVLKEVRELNRDIMVGQILYAAAGNLNFIDVDFYTIKQSMLNDRFIENAHKQGRSVWVWTVNDAVNIKEVLKFDVDGIITDYPKRVQDIMGR